MVNNETLMRVLDALPDQLRGPGGVIGVVKDGQPIAMRAWGYSDLAQHRAMSVVTRLPICSISKQFTCGVLLDQFPDIDALDPLVAAFLPNFTGPLPTIRELGHNQSGLRDYWALTILHGAKAEQHFKREDALPVFARMKTGHFAPGTSYSYSNGNFRLLGEIIERETGKDLETLYRDVIWGPAGMETAVLTSDTRQPADDVIGYEGSDATGFFPVENAMYWFGDAGISASLTDMLAYESWIDRTRFDVNSLYGRLSAPPTFKNGAKAYYGFGLAHQTVAGVAVTGHGGALRGFRAFRMHAASERLSVVVMLNHEGDVFNAASSVMKAALGYEDPKPRPMPDSWDGQWICRQTGLLTRVEADTQKANLHFAVGAETLTAGSEGTTLQGEGISLTKDGITLKMRRDAEDLSTILDPLPYTKNVKPEELDGRYTAHEIEADIIIEVHDGGVYARFEGLLGMGIMERLHPVGPDTWIVATRRSLDAPAPGDWTLSIQRNTTGTITGFTLGCWLARQIAYTSVA
jgi:D-aminopeptidase